MNRRPLTQRCALVLRRGDITAVDTDAIVNAANPKMLGGGGVDGAIHRAAGPKLLEACRRVPSKDGVRCPTGEARLTPGFALAADHVIHTVGPVYRRAEDAQALLAAAHANSLALAKQAGLSTVAFPALSCGAYGYPVDEAAAVALRTCRDHAEGLEELHFVLYDEAAWRAWCDAADALLGPPVETS